MESSSLERQGAAPWDYLRVFSPTQGDPACNLKMTPYQIEPMGSHPEGHPHRIASELYPTQEEWDFIAPSAVHSHESLTQENSPTRYVSEPTVPYNLRPRGGIAKTWKVEEVGWNAIIRNAGCTSSKRGRRKRRANSRHLEVEDFQRAFYGYRPDHSPAFGHQARKTRSYKRRK